jgi:hypothetical protein
VADDDDDDVYNNDDTIVTTLMMTTTMMMMLMTLLLPLALYDDDVWMLSGVAHRDLCPANILVSGDNTLKLADFGHAIYYRTGDPLCEDYACGTPGYQVKYENEMK